MTGLERVAVVGPGAAFRGGIATHTAELARRLHEAGHLSEHASWGRQFPRWLYPGAAAGASSEGVAASDRASAGPATTYELHWNRPDTWLRVARRLRGHADRLIMVVSSPKQLPALRTIASSFRGPRAPSRPVTLIVHNVQPHEASRVDPWMMRCVLEIGDVVVVHSSNEARSARTLGARNVRSLALPFHPPPGFRTGAHPAGEKRMGTLAFLGFVRPYKGLDLLIDALSRTHSTPRLVVRGEFWQPVEKYRAMSERLGVSERIDLFPSYATAQQMSEALGSADALVLPYRSVTATQQPRLAFACGVPVIATRVGNLDEEVRDEIDGLTVEAKPADLARAIDAFYEDELWLRLRRNVIAPDPDAEWREYLAATLRR